MKYSCAEDLDTLLLRVTQELKVYCTTKGEKQINETLLRGVTRKLFFNPGLSSSSSHPHYLSQTQTSSSSVSREARLEMTGLTRATNMMNMMDEVWSGIGVEMMV